MAFCLIKLLWLNFNTGIACLPVILLSVSLVTFLKYEIKNPISR